MWRWSEVSGADEVLAAAVSAGDPPVVRALMKGVDRRLKKGKKRSCVCVCVRGRVCVSR